MWQISGESSATSSRSEEVVQLIIVGWLVQNFRQEIRQSHYRNDPVKYDLNSNLSQLSIQGIQIQHKSWWKISSDFQVVFYTHRDVATADVSWIYLVPLFQYAMSKIFLYRDGDNVAPSVGNLTMCQCVRLTACNVRKLRNPFPFLWAVSCSLCLDLVG